MLKIKDIIGGMVEKKLKQSKFTGALIYNEADDGFNSCLNTEVSVDEMAMLRHIEDDFKYDKLTGMNSLEMLLLVTSIARVIKQGKIVRIK